MLAKLKDRDYEHKMELLKSAHSELAHDISDKQDVMMELIKAREHGQALRKQYENKISELEREMDRVQKEKDNAMSEKTTDDSKTKAAVAKYQKELKALQAKLQEFRCVRVCICFAL